MTTHHNQGTPSEVAPQRLLGCNRGRFLGAVAVKALVLPKLGMWVQGKQPGWLCGVTVTRQLPQQLQIPCHLPACYLSVRAFHACLLRARSACGLPASQGTAAHLPPVSTASRTCCCSVGGAIPSPTSGGLDVTSWVGQPCASSPEGCTCRAGGHDGLQSTDILLEQSWLRPRCTVFQTLPGY